MSLFFLEILVSRIWPVLELFLFGQLFLFLDGFFTILQLCRRVIVLVFIAIPNKGFLCPAKCLGALEDAMAELYRVASGVLTQAVPFAISSFESTLNWMVLVIS